MKKPTLFSVAAVAIATVTTAAAHADDNMFPPAPAAKAAIDFDGRGFLLNGKRTFITSGSLHYARVPRALWRERLLQMKRAGFNAVETYAFWNVHEPREGQWDFTGEKDLGAFLDTARDLGIYVTVRVGPYVCAEWDSGGYPVWLRNKGVKVRQADPGFLRYTDRWLDKVLPIVAARQMHRGKGTVILVQLENEHPRGWGTDIPADPVFGDYFRRLQAKALAHGIEVPYFFSGVHHGNDPAGNRSWDSRNRTTPWFTTEFWPGWFDLYGPLDAGRLRKFDRGTWKILAYGGNGYNYYMLHGGSDFGFTNSNEDASSYDYAGAIGQTGDLRPIYYRFKRAAWFARSFANVLADSVNDDAAYQNVVKNPAVKVTARTSPSGTIIFLDNPGNDAIVTGLVSDPSTSLLLAGGEIFPLLKNVSLGNGLTIAECTARVIGIARQGETTTLVVDGLPGTNARVVLEAEGAASAPTPGKPVATFAFSIPREREPLTNQATYTAPSGAQVRILPLGYEQAKSTWFVEAGGKEWVVVGPSFVGDATLQNNRLTLETARPWNEAANGNPTVYIFGEDLTTGPQKGTYAPSPLLPDPAVPTLAPWEARTASDPARPDFAAKNWTAHSDAPLQMGADGDESAYAWYRATLQIPTTDTYTLRFTDGGDGGQVFVDGAPVGTFRGRGPRVENVSLSAGPHALAVFTAHYGRDKLFNFMGPLEQVNKKGISGPVVLIRNTDVRNAPPPATVIGWQWRRGDNSSATPPAETEMEGWQPYREGQDVFNRRPGVAWVRAILPPVSAQGFTLHFPGVDDQAEVYLNGKRLTTHDGWDEPFDVTIKPEDLRPNGQPNVLLVRVRNNDNTGGVNGPVEARTPSAADGKPIIGWRMKGGPGSPDGVQGGTWKPAAQTAPGVPTLFRTSFTLNARPGDAKDSPQPVLRLSTRGLSRGFVYLNGHNLGRYPEKIPVDGVWLPECWLKVGKNDLAVFDEEGKLIPSDVKIIVEEAASRIRRTVTVNVAP